jgi:hypothetical protein
MITAILAGFLPVLAWNIECILKFPSSAFLRKTNLGEDYSTSIDLNLIILILFGFRSSIIGVVFGIFGHGLRNFIANKKHRGDSTSNRLE